MTVTYELQRKKGEAMLFPASPLDEARDFAAQILWAPPWVLDVLAAVACASSLLDCWRTVPRVLATSEAGAAGKTTLLDVLALLAHNPWDATGATSFSIRSKYIEPEKPFVLIDEISTIFGKSGLQGENSELGRIIRHGYRRRAKISMSVNRVATDVPVFSFMAFGGLKTAVPADIRSRCIVIPLEPVPLSVRLDMESTDPDAEALGELYAQALHDYARRMVPLVGQLQKDFTPPHPLFRGRKDQVWRPLHLVAQASDAIELARWESACKQAAEQGTPEPERPACDWAQRIVTAFKKLALDASDLPSLNGWQLLLQYAAEWMREQLPSLPPNKRFVFAADLRDWLRGTEEELFENLTDRRLEQLMTKALGPSQVLTRDGRTARGFMCAPAITKWEQLEASFYPHAEQEGSAEPSLFDDIQRN
jgi:hypothetical protein